MLIKEEIAYYIQINKRDLIREYENLSVVINNRIRELNKYEDEPTHNGYANGFGDLQNIHKINAIAGKISVFVEIYNVIICGEINESTTKDTPTTTNKV